MYITDLTDSHIISASAENLNIEVKNQHLMSDHLSFAQAGVPAISIQSREHTIHSASDTFENINRESVDRCLRLSLEIIKRTLDSSEN